MEGRSLESKSLLVRAESPEVLGSLGHDIGTKLEQKRDKKNNPANLRNVYKFAEKILRVREKF